MALERRPGARSVLMGGGMALGTPLALAHLRTALVGPAAPLAVGLAGALFAGVVFFATAVFCTGTFCVGAFFAVAFFCAGTFCVGAFFVGAFFVAGALFAGVVFFAVAFFAVAFFVEDPVRPCGVVTAALISCDALPREPASTPPASLVSKLRAVKPPIWCCAPFALLSRL